MINRSIIITLLTAALAVPAVADLQLGQTYNSGYSGSTALSAGSVDTDFTLYSNAYGITLPVVANPIPVAWGTPPAGAQWISPTENQTDNPPLPIQGSAPGNYVYQAELDTNFLIATAVTFNGSFEADNSIVLYINGQEVTSVANPAFGNLYTFAPVTFTIGAGSVQTPISFFINNVADGNTFNGTSENPTGLLVSGLKAATAAPEPGTWLLLFSGVTVLALVHRLRGAAIL